MRSMGDCSAMKFWLLLFSFIIHCSAGASPETRPEFGFPESNAIKVSTVQELNKAISELRSGAVIRLAAGVYELDTVLRITVPRVTLVGNSPKDTILKCVPESVLGTDFKRESETAGFYIAADGVTLKYLAVTSCRNRGAVIVRPPASTGSLSTPFLRSLKENDDDPKAVVRFDGCRFEDNRIENTRCFAFGAAINLLGVEAQIIQCLFIDNFSHQTGGAIYAKESSMTITETSFISAVAGSDGGAISATNGPYLKLERCSIEKSSVKGGNGGALLVFLIEEIVMNKCRFEGNRAERSDGGALAASRIPKLTITKSVFIDNFAKRYGGAMSMYQTDVVISEATISGNIAGMNGAAVCFKPTAQNRFHMEHSSIKSNVVDGTCPTIYIFRECEYTLKENVFKDNSITSGVYGDDDDTDDFADTAICLTENTESFV